MKLLSDLTTGLVGQPMLEILNIANAMAAAGRKIYRFEVGDSDFDAYPHVVAATRDALDAGHTKYVSSAGIEPLRQAICQYTRRFLGFAPDLTQVVAMPANSIIDFTIRCVANRGDEVIFPDPGFPTYQAVCSYTGVKEVRVPLRAGFRLDPDDLAARITPRTRLIIINTPCNPTGAVMSEEEVRGVAAVAEKHDLYLLSDEIYAENIYQGRHYSPSFADHCRERTIILSGFSKGHSMSGWRLGYAIGPAPLIEKMGLMFNTIFTCLPPFIQHAGVAALSTERRLMDERLAYYLKLRDLAVSRLNSIPGISCPTPAGAIYAFPDITGTGLTSREFARFVLEEAGVALSPGVFFGPSGDGHVRICYLRDEQVIEEACAAMQQALAGRKKAVNFA
jgi:aspartate/methionine/tyrosine aminotransferase